MSRVSLSRRDAEALLEVATRADHGHFLPCETRAFCNLRAALRPSPKKLAARKERRAEKATKREAHNSETWSIYGQIEDRADGDCEACRQPFSFLDPPEMDHQAGRGRAPQTVENCWLIHRESCHRKKTDGVGGARLHLERFIAHCERHGFRAEAERARARLEGIVTARERYADRAKGAKP